MTKLFLIPAENAQILGFSEDVLISVIAEKKPNPVVMKMNDSDELFVGELVKDELFNLSVLYTGKNFTNPVCVSPDDAEIVGSVCAVASAKKLNFIEVKSNV